MYPPADAAAFRAYLARATRDEHAAYLVTMRDSGELVGVANLNHIVRGGLQSAYLGFYAFAPRAGEGLMREGLSLVLARAFGPHRLHRLEANVQPGNARSLALIERLGFEREGFSKRYLELAGRWRDHERWALRAEAWRAAARRPQRANG